MTVELTVRAVRDQIYQPAGGPASAGVGKPSTTVLGQMFHEVFSDLVRRGSDHSAQAALDEAEPALDAWSSALVHHAYRYCVGPRLRRHQAQLHESAEHVLSFWQAVRELCGWLAELHWTIKEHESTASRATPVNPAERLFSAEETLACELHGPNWSDSVRLTGVADSVLRVPATGRWCVVELKLGRTSPEADLVQVCLYHQILASRNHSMRPSRTDGVAMQGTMALVSFEPGRHEQLFNAQQLEPVRHRLMELIGRMAGVVPAEGAPPPAAAAPAPPAPEHEELGRRLVDVLREYGARITLDGPPRAGPAFLRFPVTLGAGVKLSTVQARANEIRIRLGLEAPPRIGIEGGHVVIDLQRPDRRIVLFSEIRRHLPPIDSTCGNAQVVLGVDLDGRVRFADFAQPEHAHVLVAGTTGSGKSEWLRVAVAGLLATNTPRTLRLLLIDPKRNAFTALRGSPFLFTPIVYPDEQPGADVLKSLADEMDARYQRMSRTAADTWTEHVRRLGKPEPRIVCICDEYSDLVMQNRDERRLLEQQIFRLGAKARAAGIHLILATQQPSREIIKGALDANMPARVGLRMEKPIESRMLLGTTGAESLLGQGDLLFRDIGEPVRLQSAYLPPEERERAFGVYGD